MVFFYLHLLACRYHQYRIDERAAQWQRKEETTVAVDGGRDEFGIRRDEEADAFSTLHCPQ